MAEMKTTHREVEIIYDEQSDRWEYTLRGKERFASSLSLAKEAIDSPAPKDKKAFTPVEGYIEDGYGGSRGYVKVKITSIIDEAIRLGHGPQCWVITEKGKARSKVNLSSVFAVSKMNDQSLAQIAELRLAREKIDKRIENTKRLLMPAVTNADAIG